MDIRSFWLLILMAGCAGSMETDGAREKAAVACPANIGAWTPGTTYPTGAVVTYDGGYYECRQGHTALSVWPPDQVLALWLPVMCSTGGPPSPPNNPPPNNPPPNNPPPNGGDGRLFVGYFQSWSDNWAATGDGTGLAKIATYINVVNVSFMQPAATYEAGSFNLSGTGLSFSYDGPTLRDAVKALKARAPNVKVLVSVGGATFPNWSSFNPQSIAAFVNDFGLDGVDLDYEPGNPSCSNAGGSVQCPSDAEYVGVVNAMRAALPRPKWVTIAAWSVGAFGEDQWASAPPASAYMGIALAVLKQAGSALDLVNVMSYDASDAYNPEQALAAYQHYFSGNIAMGVEVPPEAWGGHVETTGEIDTLASAVKGSGGAGLMLWSLQKQGPTQQFATEICNQLLLGNCNDGIFSADSGGNPPPPSNPPPSNGCNAQKWAADTSYHVGDVVLYQPNGNTYICTHDNPGYDPTISTWFWDPHACSNPPPSNPPPSGGTLTFSDEFDGAAGPVDGSKWNFDIGGGGWGNNELEFYTNRTDNAMIDGNGHLNIIARAESFGGKAYTSARLNTAGKFSQSYGRFEARIKLPSGTGIWPAFWALGDNIGSAGWPTCGELDIMEAVGNFSINHGSAHGPGYSGGNPLTATYQAPSSLADDFHVYAIEWEPGQVRWYVDDNLYETRTPADLPPGAPWVYDHPFFMILNVAVGGNWPGAPDGSTVFPQMMQIDYVRAYTKM